MTAKALLLLVVSACLFATACERSRVEPSNVSANVPSAPNNPPYKPGPQPTEAELRDALKRNYENAVTIDNSQSVPFLLGDFNHDGSEDIAIVVKPTKGKLSDVNGEFVNWILEDPRQIRTAGQKYQPVEVKNNEPLLAVIHGHEREGWRSDLARQTFLLTNAVCANLSEGAIRWTGGRYSWQPASRATDSH